VLAVKFHLVSAAS